MAYAQNTAVPVSHSRAELERTLERYGASEFGILTSVPDESATVLFKISGSPCRITIRQPEKDDKESRRLWRVLIITVKAKLESVDAGISTVREEFMANLVLPNGQTVKEWAGPQLERFAQQDLPLLPGPA